MPRRRRPYNRARAVHDRTGKQFYADLPAGRMVATEIPDAFVHPSQHQPVESPPGGEWITPAISTLIVARTRRDDIVGNLFARGKSISRHLPPRESFNRARWSQRAVS